MGHMRRYCPHASFTEFACVPREFGPLGGSSGPFSDGHLSGSSRSQRRDESACDGLCGAAPLARQSERLDLREGAFCCSSNAGAVASGPHGLAFRARHVSRVRQRDARRTRRAGADHAIGPRQRDRGVTTVRASEDRQSIFGGRVQVRHPGDLCARLRPAL
jgi:hypothetical protein